MRRVGEEIHLDGDEARGGSTENLVRYVLVISLGLAILALSVIWISRAVADRHGQVQPATAEEHALSG